MAEFQPFNLGQVLQTAEVIKGARRQENTDKLRDAYLGQQIQAQQQQQTIAGNAEQRAATQFSQEQQVENTKLLHAASAEIRANPAAASRWLPQLQQAGVIDPNMNWQQMAPEQLQAAAGEIFESTSAALGAMVSQDRKFEADQRTTAAATAFGREKELTGIQHGNRLTEIEAQGRITADRAASADGRKTFKDTQALRKEFESMEPVKNFRAVQPIIQSAKNAPDTGFGDLDMIYAVGKILDPNSVVREGELALTIAAGSPLQRIIGASRFSTENGGRLTQKSRQQLLSMLDGRVGALEEQYNNERKRYSGYAQENGWDPGSIVGAAPANSHAAAGAASAAGGWSIRPL